VARWKAVASDKDAVYDDVVNFRAEEILPTVTWGITPGQAVFINEAIPDPKDLPEKDRDTAAEAIEHMKLPAGTPVDGIKVDVAFIGSCTNGRLSDLQEVAKHIRGRKVSPDVKAIVVPGSQVVASIAEKMGLAEIFREAGFEWRGAGCSMCLGMNPDKLVGDQLAASSSNRNFKGRQGSPTGRTMLMSPLMVAAAALTGKVSDARKVFGIN
jgi:3-isopropylmalate/(R)-2-methylmalate dehydratase large subunit